MIPHQTTAPTAEDLPRRTTITALARAAMLQARQDATEQQAAAEAEHRLTVVTGAQQTAVEVLGEQAAAQLNWEPVADAGEGVYEATATLRGVPGAVLRWRVVDECTSSEPKPPYPLTLVRGCSACGQGRIEPVPSLAELGELLTAGGAW